MATNNSSNIKTAASGKVLQGQGVGSALDFSTCTYPSTSGTVNNVLTSDGTNWISSPATSSVSTGDIITQVFQGMGG